MHSVGIEPTLFRTRALSVRLNRSAISAYLLTYLNYFIFWKHQKKKKEAPAGIEPAIYCLRSSCLNHLAIEPLLT